MTTGQEWLKETISSRNLGAVLYETMSSRNMVTVLNEKHFSGIPIIAHSNSSSLIDKVIIKS